MARYFDVHPANPQPRTIAQVVDLLKSDGLIAYPTDSCFALGCQLGNRDGLDRIRSIRHLDDSHHFTLRSEEHTSELQSRQYLVCRLLLEKKKTPASQP